MHAKANSLKYKLWSFTFERFSNWRQSTNFNTMPSRSLWVILQWTQTEEERGSERRLKLFQTSTYMSLSISMKSILPCDIAVEDREDMLHKPAEECECWYSYPETNLEHLWVFATRTVWAHTVRAAILYTSICRRTSGWTTLFHWFSVSSMLGSQIAKCHTRNLRTAKVSGASFGNTYKHKTLLPQISSLLNYYW